MMSVSIKEPDCYVGVRFGTKFNGDLVIVEFNGKSNVVVEFVETKYRTTTSMSRILSGYVRDRLRRSVYGVGYDSGGEHKQTLKRKRTKEYSLWESMLRRCYSEKDQKKHPTYIGVKVCDEWHDFQNFARWVKDNYPSDGGKYDIDKDMLSGEEKIYSPDTCKFITRKENMIIAYSRYYKFKNIHTGEIFECQSQSEFSDYSGVPSKQVSAIVTGKAKTAYGWSVYE